jgi:hypothetical protein
MSAARLSLLLLLAFCATVLNAQGALEEDPFLSAIALQQGVFVTPVANIPFSAMVVVQQKHPLQDGTTRTLISRALVARDSNGRIHNERHALVPDTFAETPPLISTHIFDPATRISVFLNPSTLIARRLFVLPPRQDRAGQHEQKDDLGYTTLNGLPARGTRITRIIYVTTKDGTREPHTVMREFWYSDDLQMNILERFSNGLGGEISLALLPIHREEPPPSLFEVPSGYKLVDVTPPANAPVMRLQHLIAPHRSAVASRSTARRAVPGSSPNASIQCTSGSRRNHVNCRLA